MNRNISWVVLIIFQGCATKHKLLHQTKESTLNQHSQQNTELRYISSGSFKVKSDSTFSRYWFKLYPKGEFRHDKGVFSGQIDSIIGYGDSFKLHKSINAKQADTLLSNHVQKTETQVTAKEKYVKEKNKSYASWWYWCLPLLFLAFILFWFKQKTK